MCLLQLGDNNNYFKLKVLEKMTTHSPTPGDVRAEGHLKLGEFEGRYSNVWLAQPDIANVVNQLVVLESTRQGSATLEAMSPEEFSLELYSIDELGHYKAIVHLGRYQTVGLARSLVRLTGQVNIEPDQLPASLAFFKGLLLDHGA